MPPVMYVLVPLTTKWSPSATALVARLATSEPPPGSVIASEMCFSPAITGGATRSRTASLAKFTTGGRPMLWTISVAATPPTPIRASSSLTMLWNQMSTPSLTPP